jgi:antitoxin (DNA-binding transcriptional repressor) of toxin-antitoxin stability system
VSLFKREEAMQISIRELKANPAHAIALTRSGERVQITSHRKVVAELVAPAPQTSTKPQMTDQEAMQRLLASGFVAEPATKPLKLGKAMIFPPGPNGQTMSDLVLELRGPR